LEQSKITIGIGGSMVAGAPLRAASELHHSGKISKGALDQAEFAKAIELPLQARAFQDKLFVLFAVIELPVGCWV
jgi:hypothetical protein